MLISSQKTSTNINTLKIPKIIGLVTFFVGTLVTLAWIFNISLLQSVIPNAVTMKFSTAIAFVFSGITIYFMAQYRDGSIGKAQIVIPMSGLIIFLFMATIVFSYLIGINSGIERLFVNESPNAIKTVESGRPSIPTAINFILIASTGLFVISRSNLDRVVNHIGYVISTIGAIPIIGYIVEQPQLYYYVPNINTGMAIHTASLFVGLGIAIILLRKNFSRSQLETLKIQTKMTFLFLASSLIPIIFVVGLSYSNIEPNPNNEPVKIGMLIIGVISGVLSVIFSLLMARSFSKPILALRDVSLQISNGNHTVRADESSNDEIGELSKTFNVMMNDVIKSEKMSSIGAVTSRIAHDLRNPISVISGTVEIMKNSPYDDSMKLHFERIDRALSRINHQINDVLDFVRTTPLKIEDIEFEPLIKSVISKIKISEKIQIRIVGSAKFECDVVKIETVFINLILNSIQAIRDSGIITISTSEKNNKITIQVYDSGVGISEEDLPKIFEPLFTTKQHGTGLGLVSCKTIIEQHGGTILFEINPTRVTITLPKSHNKSQMPIAQIE